MQIIVRVASLILCLSLSVFAITPSAWGFSFNIERLVYNQVNSDFGDFTYDVKASTFVQSGDNLASSPSGASLYPYGVATLTAMDNVFQVGTPNLDGQSDSVRTSFQSELYEWAVDFSGFSGMNTSYINRFGLDSGNTSRPNAMAPYLIGNWYTGVFDGVYHTNALALNFGLLNMSTSDEVVYKHIVLTGLNPSTAVVGLRWVAAANGTYVTFYYRINRGPWIVIDSVSSQGLSLSQASPSLDIDVANDNPGNITSAMINSIRTDAVSVPADGDSDSLPDTWEQTNFMTLGYGANDDPDGDGLTNLEEYSGGTDPSVADATSVSVDITSINMFLLGE